MYTLVTHASFLRGHPMQSNAASFRTLLNTEIESWLQQSTTRYQAIASAPAIQDILSHLTVVSQGGKRIRPFLVWSVYQHYLPEAKESELLPLLKALELFHVFCLIHDDVMDEATVRHGVETIQTFAEKKYYARSNGLSSKRIAENQAILAGDILFNAVFTLLHEFKNGTHPHRESIHAVFSTLIDEVCIGQMIDVHLTSQATASVAEIEQKNRLKTAYYTFARPLHMGVLAAGKPELVPFVLAFGEQLGLLFQLQDDVLDIMGDTKDTKKPTFQDVTQNQHTLLSAYIREHDGDAKDLLEDLTGKTLTPADQAELKSAFIASGAVTHAEGLISVYEMTAHALLKEHDLGERDADYFSSLIGLLTKRTS